MNRHVMKKLRKENLIYFSLTIFLVVGGFVFLRYEYYVASEFPFTQEFVLVILGVIATVLVTALLLNKQTEVELRKEGNIKFLDLKTRIYMEFLDYQEQVMRRGKTSHEDDIELQFLTHKLALVANPDVLRQYHEFLEVFSTATEDDTIHDQEEDLINAALARLTVAIRQDLIGELDEQTDYSPGQISRQIIKNIQTLDD